MFRLIVIIRTITETFLRYINKSANFGIPKSLQNYQNVDSVEVVSKFS